MAFSSRLTAATIAAALVCASQAHAQGPSIYEPAQSSGGGVGDIRSGEGAPARGASTHGIRLPRNTDKSIYEPAENSGGGVGNIRSGEGAPPLSATTKRRAPPKSTGAVRN